MLFRGKEGGMTPEVNAKARALLMSVAEDLRSGKLRWTRNVLHVGDEFCSLGLIQKKASLHDLFQRAVYPALVLRVGVVDFFVDRMGFKPDPDLGAAGHEKLLVALEATRLLAETSTEQSGTSMEDVYVSDGSEVDDALQHEAVVTSWNDEEDCEGDCKTLDEVVAAFEAASRRGCPTYETRRR
jgi:hypothetical protein